MHVFVFSLMSLVLVLHLAMNSYSSTSLKSLHSLISFTNLFCFKVSSLSAAHILGLAAFVVHLHASMSHSHLVQLVPPILPTAVPVGEALGSALLCSTHTHMLSCVRWDFFLQADENENANASYFDYYVIMLSQPECKWNSKSSSSCLDCVWRLSIMGSVEGTQSLSISDRTTFPAASTRRYRFLLTVNWFTHV